MKRILVIDSNVDYYNILVNKFEMVDAELFFVRSFLEAKTLVSKVQFDLILVNKTIKQDDGDQIRDRLLLLGVKVSIVLLDSNPCRECKDYIIDKVLPKNEFIKEINKFIV